MAFCDRAENRLTKQPEHMLVCDLQYSTGAHGVLCQWEAQSGAIKMSQKAHNQPLVTQNTNKKQVCAAGRH